jgi:hypothetical protein
MARIMLTFFAIMAFLSEDVVFQPAHADGIAVPKPRRKAVRRVVPACVPGHCVVPYRRRCPDRYSCYSLYGAYGPYGGSLYWSRYTYRGWGAWR